MDLELSWINSTGDSEIQSPINKKEFINNDNIKGRKYFELSNRYKYPFWAFNP